VLKEIMEEHKIIWTRGYQIDEDWHYVPKDKRAAVCTCGWIIVYDWDNDSDEPIIKPKKKGVPWTRISRQKEIQEAIDSGVTGSKLLRIAQQYNFSHWILWSSLPFSFRKLTIKQ
jgi:hypothetical protein